MRRFQFFNSFTVLISGLLLSTLVGTAQLAPPAGVVRVTVPAAQDVLASLPFVTESAAVQEVLGAAPFPEGAMVFKWNSASQSYESATLVDGIWSTAANDNTASDLTLNNGEGFVLRHPGETDIHVYLSGLAVIDKTFTIPLLPGLSLIAPPYSADTVGLPAPLAPEVLAPQAENLLMGQAYWHHSTNDDASFWDATPPYALTFSPAALPSITKITIEGDAAILTIAGHNAGPIDIFYHDIDVQGAHLEPGDWRLASRIQTQGRTDIVWADREGKQRPFLRDVAGRYYAVASGAIDLDANGVADGADVLIHGRTQNAVVRDADASHIGAPLAEFPQTAVAKYADLDTIYVDCHTGKDVLAKTGESPSGTKSS